MSKARVGVRRVRKDPIEPGMKSLTNCQTNKTRVEVQTVRMD